MTNPDVEINELNNFKIILKKHFIKAVALTLQLNILVATVNTNQI